MQTQVRPWRLNTERSALFITEFLSPLLQAISRVELDPTLAVEAGAQFTDQSLITEFSYNHDFKQVRICMSPLALTKAYGKPATRIWRKLFAQVQIGCHDPITRTKIKTSWAPSKAAVDQLAMRTVAILGKRNAVTASEYLQVLADLPEIVASTVEYAEVFDNLGFKRLVKKPGTKKKLVTREERQAILAAQKPKREELNNYNAERFTKMREQQTFDPEMQNL
jgi:hypothetical protein